MQFLYLPMHKLTHQSVSNIYKTGFFCLFLLSALFVSTNVRAQNTTADSLRDNISVREESIKQLEAEIAEYKSRLTAVGDQKKTLQTAIQSLDLSRAKLAKDMALTKLKIERANASIVTLSTSITDKQKHIDKNKSVINDIMRRIDVSDSDTMIEALLANSSLSEFIIDVDDLSKLQTSVRDNIKSLKSLQNELGVSKTSVQAERKKLLSLNAQLGDQKQIADSERIEQASLLATTKNQESTYKKVLAEREARKKQFETEINDYENQLRAAIDPSLYPVPGTKVFSFPLDDPLVTQKFGKTVDARRLYVSGTHNGTDFRASPGTIIKAAADGIVTATGDTDKACPNASYGRWVLIRHGTGLSTLYGHLELIKVKAGQQVLVGDTVGYSGNTGYSTGPHLHFTVYVTKAVQVIDMPSKTCKNSIFHLPVAPLNAYLDPESYL
jgi:murein DD-endopeptidase MepM/ murein hydrolase activator NlpD